MLGLNNKIAKSDGLSLDWKSEWHNIAYNLSKKNAEGVDLTAEEELIESKVRMMDSMVFKYFYMRTFSIDAMPDSEPIQKTVTKFFDELVLRDGTQQNVAIGIYQKDKVAYFTMISAVEEINQEKADKLKSETVGKFALDMVNEHRATLELTKIEWNDDLHNLAYLQSKDITENDKAAVAPANDVRLANIQETIPTAVSVGEIITESDVKRTSKALKDVFDDWENWADTEFRTVMETAVFNQGAIAVFSKFEEAVVESGDEAIKDVIDSKYSETFSLIYAEVPAAIL